MCSVKPPNDLSDKGHAVEEWLDLRFFRPIGIRIARALYPTGISPDQVTLWSLLIGLVAGHLFVYQDRWIDVIGFVLFIVSDVFDSADGQLARLRGSSTRFGRALDGISDNLRFVNLYFHLMYRLIHGGVWWPGAALLVACAGLAHTFQRAGVGFVRNAFLYVGSGKAGARHISAFRWAEAVPMSLLLVVLLLMHEWNATTLAALLEHERHAYVRVT